MKTRTRSRQAVQLSADQEALAQRIFARIQGKLNDELLDMVRAMAAKEPGELLGAGEFELRDRLNDFGATLLEESINAQAKKGVPGC